MTSMKVADFFCGAGGFSEGFRQKGFKIAFALDNWRPAIETHRFNHGEGCIHSDKNILDIAPQEIDDIIPDTEVIIGSPPCVAFSGSNKAGKADKSLGLSLIHKYLQIIAHKKNKKDSILKYWILENVPNSQRYIKEKYTFKELGLEGGDRIALLIKRNQLFNAADYGAPQTRTRMLCGDFPEPTKLFEDPKQWVTLGAVISSLEANNTKDGFIDVNYGFTIPKEHLTDHFYDTTVDEFEWRKAMSLKQDHSFMGKMSFPEDESRPSRTIMATMSSSTREAMIIGSRRKPNTIYRRPTIREIATIMSFPITYQFIGNSEATKYKLVGNAVCSKLAAAVAEAIISEKGLRPKYEPNPHVPFKAPPFDLNGRKREPKDMKPKRLQSKFRAHVPFIKIRSFRADLDNLSSDFQSERFVWKSMLHYGTGKNAKSSHVSTQAIEKTMVLVTGFNEFKKDVERSFLGSLPNPKAFQMSYCKLTNGDTISPEKALDMAKSLVDKHFPEASSLRKEVNNSLIKIGSNSIPLRVLAACYACNIISETVMSTGC